MKLEDLTLREKIGQTMIMLCTVEKFIEEFGSIENFIKKYPIGGFYPCGGLNESGLMIRVHKDECDKVMEECNKYSKVPLIMSADGPNDQKGTVSFGSLMLLGAANDEELAYEYGKITGEKISSCNIHWSFSPVVDLNMSAASPVVNTRSLSDNPDRAIPLAKAIIRGMQDAGIAACAKHFPGTDDNDRVDPHLAPVNNNISKEKWDATNGKMYSALFDEDVMSVMTGHQNLVCYQTEKINGRFPATTMSKDIVSGLLKQKLGFKGVVVTDALCMGGFVGKGGLENQARSFAAGNDMMLWPDIEYMDLVEEKILSGEIPMERLDDAVTRILALKEKLGILDGSFEPRTYDEEKATQVSQKISEKGLTLVQNELGVVPCKNLKKVLVVCVTPNDAAYESMKSFKDIFAKYGIEAEVKRDIVQAEFEAIQDNYDMTVFALSRTTHAPIGPLQFWEKNATSIWASNSGDPHKKIVCSFGSPYHYEYYCETPTTYINAYSFTPTVYEAFVKAIIGEIEFQGKSPVELI